MIGYFCVWFQFGFTAGSSFQYYCRWNTLPYKRLENNVCTSINYHPWQKIHAELDPSFLHIAPLLAIHEALNCKSNVMPVSSRPVWVWCALWIWSSLSYLSAGLSSRSCESGGSHRSGGSTVPTTTGSSLLTRLTLEREGGHRGVLRTQTGEEFKVNQTGANHTNRHNMKKTCLKNIIIYIHTFVWLWLNSQIKGIIQSEVFTF